MINRGRSDKHPHAISVDFTIWLDACPVALDDATMADCDGATSAGSRPSGRRSQLGTSAAIVWLFAERLAERIISARRNTACICVRSHTDREHFDPFLGSSSSVKTRHRPCWVFVLNAHAFLGTSRDDAGSLEGRGAAEIQRTPHPSSAMQASARRLLHPAAPPARALSSSTFERLSSLGSFCLQTRRSDQSTAGHKLRLLQQWLPLGNSFRDKTNLPVSPISILASIAAWGPRRRAAPRTWL